MEIISIESQQAEGRRLSDRQGIALTNSISDLELVSDNDVLIQGICIVYIESGKASFNIAGEECKPEAGELLFINYGQRAKDLMYSMSLRFKAFFLSKEFMLSLSTRLNLSWNIRSDMMQTSHLKFQLNESEARIVNNYYELLDSKRQQTLHQQEGIDALCEAFGYELLDIMERHELLTRKCLESSGIEHSAMQQHFDRFMELLLNGNRMERKVNWYAEQLCITPKYLNMICQQVIQKSPSDLIEEEISQQAMHLLRDSSLSIKQISQQLGFNNQSHFGTFLRRTVGKSPLEIRNES